MPIFIFPSAIILSILSNLFLSDVIAQNYEPVSIIGFRYIYRNASGLTAQIHPRFTSRKAAVYMRIQHYVNTITFENTDNNRRLNVQLLSYVGNVACPEQEAGVYMCRGIGNTFRLEGRMNVVNIIITGYKLRYESMRGCFKTTLPTRTVESLNECTRCNHRWFAINTNQCLCLSTLYGLTAVHLSTCNRTCLGYSHQLCGGNGHFTVYTTDSSQTQALNTMNPYCAYNFTGCAFCTRGRRGFECEVLDCSVDNGNCETNQCQELSLNQWKISVCMCQTGLTINDQYECFDVDECEELFINNCDQSTTFCVNSYASYYCNCLIGYRVYNTTYCTDIDECRRDPCHSSDGICVNSIGSYICLCKTSGGFRSREDGSCEDIDECDSDTITIVCDGFSTTCKNIFGSYDCVCKPGFAKDGNFTKNCSDVDECMEERHGCGDVASCVNIPGSYTCNCSSGYQIMVYSYAVECDDINECWNPYICDDITSICLNLLGSHACLCRKRYMAIDNFTCVYDDSPLNTTTELRLRTTVREEKLPRTLEVIFYISFVIPFVLVLALLILYCYANKTKVIFRRKSGTLPSDNSSVS